MAEMVKLPDKPWMQSTDQLLKNLEVSDTSKGLSQKQVEDRLKEFGTNELPEEEGVLVTG